MNHSKRIFLIALLFILFGLGWLLNVMQVVADIDWVWTLGLAWVGFMVFILLGVDKVTFVAGSLLLVMSFFSVMRQTGKLPINYEVPILTILAGVLILVSHLAPLPRPKWLVPPEEEAKSK